MAATRHVEGRKRYIVLALIVGVALGFRLWGIQWGLYNANISRRPHPDEWVIYWLFHWYDQSRSLNPCPNAAKRCFFDWGALYPDIAYAARIALLPLLSLLPHSTFGPHADLDFVRSVLVGRLTSVLASTLTIVVVYRLGSLFSGVVGGLLAALIAALSDLLIQIAHFATPDSTTVLLMMSSLLATALAVNHPTSRRFGVAGGLAGLAAGTEYHMALLGVPLVVAWIMTGHRQKRSLLIALIAGAVTCILPNIYAVLDFDAFISAIRHTLLIRTVDSGSQYGSRFSRYGPSWLYLVRYSLGYGVGFALATLMVLSVIWAAVRRSKLDILLLCWVGPYALLVTLSSARFMRYGAPLLPVLAVLSAGLVCSALQQRRRTQRILVLTAVAIALASGTLYDAAYTSLFTKPDARLVAAQWIDAHAAKGDDVAFDELPNGLINLPYFVASEGYRPCFYEFQPARLDSPSHYVMVDDYVLEEHPIFTSIAVTRFQAALRSDPNYRVAEQVHYVPSFLGVSFPIDNSPHDWRYVSRRITIYRRDSSSTRKAAYCYRNLPAAIAALYVRPPAV